MKKETIEKCNVDLKKLFRVLHGRDGQLSEYDVIPGEVYGYVDGDIKDLKDTIKHNMRIVLLRQSELEYLFAGQSFEDTDENDNPIQSYRFELYGYNVVDQDLAQNKPLSLHWYNWGAKMHNTEKEFLNTFGGYDSYKNHLSGHANLGNIVDVYWGTDNNGIFIAIFDLCSYKEIWVSSNNLDMYVLD